jgi:hypothetical protein
VPAFGLGRHAGIFLLYDRWIQVFGEEAPGNLSALELSMALDGMELSTVFASSLAPPPLISGVENPDHTFSGREGVLAGTERSLVLAGRENVGTMGSEEGLAPLSSTFSAGLASQRSNPNLKGRERGWPNS